MVYFAVLSVENRYSAVVSAPPHPAAGDALARTTLPLYEQVAAQLQDDIAARELPPGGRLPAERELAQRYGVSRVTLRAALGLLETRGFLRSAASRGWFIADPEEAEAAASDPAPAGVLGFADEAAAKGLQSRSKVLHATVRPATVEEAARLGIAPGASMFDLRRLRYLDDQVILLQENQLALATCPSLPTTDFSSASLYATLRAAGVRGPHLAEYSVSARPPTAEEAELLEIVGNIPVLAATQVAYTEDLRPLEFSSAVYRGDRYRFRASIRH